MSAAGAGMPQSIAALYTGLTTESAKSVLDSFLFFLFYEFFKSRSLLGRYSRSRRGGAGNGSGAAWGVFEELSAGILAGACSRAFTTPIANVVIRKQTGSMLEGDEADGRKLGVREIVNSILKEKGVTGLWAGYSATLVLTLNPGMTFFLQDFLKRRLVGSERWEDPGAALTFLLAASSKAIASTITYPFQTAKARLQAGVPVGAELSPEAAEKETGGKPNNRDDTESQATERTIDKEIDTKLKATRAVQKLAQQSVFGTIAQIVRTEGVGSLYDGVHGELLKGFFSHGTTMLAKGVIHKLLFKLYLIVAALLQELKARRRQGALGPTKTRGAPSSSGQYLPRALHFKNAEVQNGPQSSNSQSSTPGFFSRLVSFGNRTAGTHKSEPGPNMILNFQDRTHRDLGKE